MRSLTTYAEKIKRIGKKAPWLYKAGTQLYIDRTFPRHLFIETTAKCNLTCEYCPREKKDDHMEFSLFRRIIDEASQYGPRSFSLHLFGEPLLWPYIMEGIRYIKKRNIRHNIILTTNGTYLNRFVEKGLLETGLDEIIWSWRKEAKFKDTTKELLKSSTVNKKTRFRVRILKQVTPPEEIEAWKNWPLLELRDLHNYGGEVNLSRFDVPSAPERWPCYHLWLAPAVAWNGNILLCCVDPHQREVLGNAKETSVAEVWQGGRLKAIRESHLSSNYEGICRDCDVWKNYPDIFFGFQKIRS